ncbi:FbpB family small basic protein [Bacillus aerolatus]|uniref:FbpB family small basic protein n=1 Tax=Bacillus aerolatus TaxID=2653354 RepID=A0A6I1FMG5_9BACI|nr:FbpB family small basic protein [Bacillus aerolatus]KAB7708219.1 FbpB family small basic protein [Bacillus aerolatus]
MRKMQRKSFAELVKENKRELLDNPDAMKAIEERLEERLEMKRFGQAK